MARTAAIYLAHLNPMTKAHEEIIASLKAEYSVYIFPVRFVRNGKEINTKSFPFSYETRKSMVESCFGSTVNVLPDYTFEAPFIRYLPPLLSPYSWKLRNRIISKISEDKFVSYTGDRAERIALQAYRLNPVRATRLALSASSVKEMMYNQVTETMSTGVQKQMGNEKEGNKATAEVRERPEGKQEFGNRNDTWYDKVPSKVASLMKENWDVVERFALAEDRTIKVMGMKFPRDGFQ